MHGWMDGYPISVYSRSSEVDGIGPFNFHGQPRTKKTCMHDGCVGPGRTVLYRMDGGGWMDRWMDGRDLPSAFSTFPSTYRF